MGKTIGIDLGSTYSCVYYVDDDGVLKAVDSAEGQNTTPSEVYFDPDGTVLVGVEARAASALGLERMVARVKNYMGDPNYRFSIDDQEYSPTDVSALILQKLVQDAEYALKEEIDGAVITIPAYYAGSAAYATIQAGERVVLKNGGHLKVLRVLGEAAAAALAYYSSLPEGTKKTVLVYDLGGGSFDCTLMNIDFTEGKKEGKIITLDGDHCLGGMDWDAALADYVRNEFCSMTGCDPEEMMCDPACIRWFIEHSERVKKILSQKAATKFVVNFAGFREKIELTREIFEEVTRYLLDRTICLVDQMLERKNMCMSQDVDEILLVGGGSKMPQVRSRLEMEYGKPVICSAPDRLVAMGAALAARDVAFDMVPAEPAPPRKSIEQDEGQEIMGVPMIPEEGETLMGIFARCTQSYGLLVRRGDEEMVSNVILKDSPYPAEGTMRLVTDVPDQSTISLEVYENDSLQLEATMEESLQVYETCTVALTPGLPEGAPIDITLCLKLDKTLEITVLDVTNGISTVMIPAHIGGDAADLSLEEIAGMALE